MASNKFTWLELRKAVAEYAHCSEQEAEIFLSALLESVVNGLKKDKQVKIKGLGVFALKPVAPRKSVNIATGQDFTIEGYNKLTFTAESMLKESVEKRIEKPATEEVINAIISDPIKKLGEQADEIIDLLADLGQIPENKNKEVTKKEKKSTKKPASVKKKKEPVTTTEVIDKPTIAENTTIQTPVKDKKKCNCKWVCWVICAVILMGAIGTSIYFHEQIIGWWQCTKIMEKTITKSQYHDIITRKLNHNATIQEQKANDQRFENAIKTVSDWWKNIKLTNKATEKEIVEVVEEVTVKTYESKQPKYEQTIQPLNANYEELNYNRAPGIQPLQPIRRETTVEEITLEEMVEDTIPSQELEMTTSYDEEGLEEEETVALAEQARVYTKFIGTEVVNKDSRLTWIAYKHYGSKDLWVFIYEANRDVISHPARVTPGLELRIPELENKYLNLSDPELRQLVDSLTIEYLK